MRPKVQPKQFILKGQPIVWVFHLLAQKAKKKNITMTKVIYSLLKAGNLSRNQDFYR